MDRRIVCFQIPALGIALARLAEPSLRDRPVAIAPAGTPRACLHEVSNEAQREGARIGMPIETARRRCPSLRLLPPDPPRLREAHQRLCGVAARFAPIWEPVQPGHLFLDLTGTIRLFGRASDAAARIEREVTRDCGLAGVAGVGSNKLVSHVAATLLHPPQLCDVRPGSEQAFLAPLPVTTLPGFGRSQAREARRSLAVLDDLNLRTLGEIAETALPALELALGPRAALVHRWARGIDLSPVLPLVQQPRLEVAETLEPDDLDDERLLGRLWSMLERLCRELRRQQRVCGRLTLTLRYSDHVEAAGTRALIPGTHWEVEMEPCLKNLFVRCFRRRVRVRRLALGAEALGAPDAQLSLFDVDHGLRCFLSVLSTQSSVLSDESPGEATRSRACRLALVLDRLRERFGEHILRYGRAGAMNISPPHPTLSRKGRGKATGR
jgi:DNA polymerase-4